MGLEKERFPDTKPTNRRLQEMRDEDRHERANTAPKRHWRSYGNDLLPTGQEALGEPLAAFPSWFMRITCDRCGKDRTVNEAHRQQATCRPAKSSRWCARRLRGAVACCGTIHSR
jgi:ribosomal 50S subunit-associated protein YjgA (DUF615 family)